MVKGGFFVVCEGPDYSGKTTNIKMSIKKLQDLGYTAGYSRGIGDNKEIETALYLHPVTESFLLSSLYETIYNIRPKLQKYDVLLQDRYLISVLAHIGLNQDKTNEKLVEYVKNHTEKPDLVVYFTATPEERMRRQEIDGVKSYHDRLLADDPEIGNKLESRYLGLIKTLDCELFTIDTTDKTIGKTSNLLVDKISKMMLKRGS